MDTNVFMYAVGRPHPLRKTAQRFFQEAIEGNQLLVTSAEVMQELMHAYIPVDRLETLDAAFRLAQGCITEYWSIEVEDIFHAKNLINAYPHLGARDLLHLSCAERRKVKKLYTFDRALSAAWKSQH